MVRVDLHLHSSASHDCSVEPERMLARCRQLGIDRLFLTDHGSIDGARWLHRRAPGAAFIGQEILTSEGELIGLFLQEEIPAGLPPEATAAAIKNQGGLVYLEHPYDPCRPHLREEAIERIADEIDVVEVFNPRSDEEANARAEELRATLGAAAGAGSDAHLLGHVGAGYVEMEEFDGSADFLRKLRAGRVVRRPSRLLMMIRSHVEGMSRRRARCHA